jgi:hypothetical protein
MFSCSTRNRCRRTGRYGWFHREEIRDRLVDGRTLVVLMRDSIRELAGTGRRYCYRAAGFISCVGFTLRRMGAS